MAVPVINYMPECKRIILTFNAEYPAGKAIHFAMKMFSDDFGRSWSCPEPLSASEQLPINSMTAYVGNGVLLAYPTGIHSEEDMTPLFRYRSDDFGQTWKRWSAIDRYQGRGFYSWDPPLVAGGKVYETGYCSNEWCRKPHEPKEVFAYYRVSRDFGNTFDDCIAPTQWRDINEVALFARKNGSLVAAGRKENYQSVLDQSDSLVISLSDEGLTWSDPVQVQPSGRMHPSMVELADGRLVMTYVVREGYLDSPDGFPRFGIEAVISHDGGHTWDSEHRHILSEFTSLYLKGNERWAASVQSTSSRLLPDGSILTAFGTAHRARFNPERRQMPRDIGLVRWTPAT